MAYETAKAIEMAQSRRFIPKKTTNSTRHKLVKMELHNVMNKCLETNNKSKNEKAYARKCEVMIRRLKAQLEDEDDDFGYSERLLQQRFLEEENRFKAKTNILKEELAAAETRFAETTRSFLTYQPTQQTRLELTLQRRQNEREKRLKALRPYPEPTVAHARMNLTDRAMETAEIVNTTQIPHLRQETPQNEVNLIS